MADLFRVIDGEKWEVCGRLETTMTTEKFFETMKQASTHPEHIRRRIFGAQTEVVEDGEHMLILKRRLFSKLPDKDREVPTTQFLTIGGR